MVSLFTHKVRSVAGLITQRRRLRSVLEVLDGIARNGMSLSRSLELEAQWGAVLAVGPQDPLCRADLAIDPDMGLLVFGACVRSLYSRLGEFLHGVVVHRRDESIRSWRNWVFGDPLVHPYRWRQPDLVPPSPFLCCDTGITLGWSGVLSDPALSSFGMPGFPTFVGQTEGSLIPLFLMQKLEVGCRLSRKLSFPHWWGGIFLMLFKKEAHCW